MPPRPLLLRRWIGRVSTATLVVAMFVVALGACVLGLVVWKGYDSHKIALAQSETEMRNLSHSLAEHATHTFQGADVVLDDIVSFMKWRPHPSPVFNERLRALADNLPQLSDVAILDADGQLTYASVKPVPALDNSDRSYFRYHRANDDHTLLITGPIQSRTSGVWVFVVSRRLETTDGKFFGVVVATIESEYFSTFYKTFDLGPGGSISLLHSDGRLLIQWPSLQTGRDMANMVLFQKALPRSPDGYYLTVSPFDGLTKYLAYRRVSRYPLVVTVARTEDSVLSGWREAVRSDAVVATAMLACVVLLAAGLAAQLRTRQEVQNLLRERDAHYRLIDTNMGDVIVLTDEVGILRFVSMSVETVLGLKADRLVGRLWTVLVHPDDVPFVEAVGAGLPDSPAGLCVEFRMRCPEGRLVWLEANFAYTRNEDGPTDCVVSTLRDITRRKAMEKEVEALNARLAELARTDGLTGLPNRRSLDGFVARVITSSPTLSVLMIDVDDFKGFNDHFGHQGGDDALRQLGHLFGGLVASVHGFAARYGGEEFTIVLPGADAVAAVDFAESLQAAVRTLAIRNPASARGYLTVSIGIACGTAPCDSTVLLRDADIALYEAKRRGRDCCVTAATAFVDDAAPLQPEQPSASADATS
ncbi:GGDEF domain-containing protein [Rhodopseudomonas palustris]|uniref:diguanylate cyclase n=2 Tax=Rhodopseudomonas palustris TaxID=1076 RepID=Q6N3S7_RHOPA|nr:GGDEF domain-containing protein [Rhodopseudomonas palustris]CAE29057.1 putative diguanylate cyclase (GGDEF) with PAS/PAC domain [Rhodopseudomonas palustris CGA009]